MTYYYYCFLQQKSRFHTSPVAYVNQKENENITDLSKEKIQGLISKVSVGTEITSDGDCGAHAVSYVLKQFVINL